MAKSDNTHIRSNTLPDDSFYDGMTVSRNILSPCSNRAVEKSREEKSQRFLYGKIYFSFLAVLSKILSPVS